MSIINPKRLQDYPRLMLITTWMFLGINLLFHQGWIGAFGQVIGGDYIVFYKTGLIYRSDPTLLYDTDTHNEVQQSLLKSLNIPSNNPFQNPPFIAPLLALITYISLPISFFIWTVLAIISVFISSNWLIKLVPEVLVKSGLTYKQLVIIILSFFPFIEGLLAGQNHWLSLILVTGIVITILKEKWYLSGFLAAMLLYKPQLIIGFIILWLVWGKYKSLLSFGIISISWVGIFVLINGVETFQIYSQMSKAYMLLPYIPGWPNYLLVTLYGFLTSIFSIHQQPIIAVVTQILLIISALGLAVFAFKLRKAASEDQTPAIVAAILLPLFATPYALAHDLVILIPGFILLTRYCASRKLLYISIITYLGSFFFIFLGVFTKFAWISLLVIFFVTVLIIWIHKNKKILFRSYQN
jgi:hypothetical protein